MDPQAIQQGFQADPNSPGMQEVMQWFLQNGGAGSSLPLKGFPKGASPEQIRQLLMIQQLRQQQNGEFDPAQQGRMGGNPMQREVMGY